MLDTERGFITQVAFSPNDALIAIGNQDGNIKVWDRHTQRYISKMERVGKINRVIEVVFSPDGQRLASSGGRYDAVYVWHYESGEQVAEFTVYEVRMVICPPHGCQRGGVNIFTLWTVSRFRRVLDRYGSDGHPFMGSCHR